jgi:hypothetical protein
MNKNEAYGFLDGFGAGFLVGFGVGFAGSAGFAVDLLDFIELEVLAPAFGEADGFGDAAIAGAVIRNAAAISDARVFFMQYTSFRSRVRERCSVKTPL